MTTAAYPPPMTAPEIAEIVAELRPLVTGAVVREVRQRGDHDLVLALRAPGRSLFLLLSAHPRASRILALTGQPRGPWRPTPFREACRRALTGTRIASLVAAPDDRRVTVVATRHGEDPACAAPTRLEAELYGRTANLLLVGGDATIVGALRPLRDRRALRPGAAYVPLGPRAPIAAGAAPWIPADRGRDELAWSRAAAQYYEPAVAAADLAAQREKLERRLAHARERATARLARIEADLAEADRAEQVRRQGELLKGELHRIRRGQHEVTLIDYFADPPAPTVIALDPRKSPEESLQALFRRYRKLRAAATKARQVRDAFAAALASLDELAQRLRAAADLPEVAALAAEALEHRLLRPPQEPPRAARRPARSGTGRSPLQFRSADGLMLLVGRSGPGNEELTFRLARGSDLWLHVRDYPGSHVVVKLPRGRPCPPETLLDAAHLAVHFSKIRGARTAAVLHTLRKHITRLRGAPAGQVSVSRSAILELRIEPARLRRLLGELV
ncbi:MAG: DUF814 domain-containing protein [Planctomycetes bacterium]|nr:DUF814 domain-containing protein [Planctomycetota bacterium]